MNTNFQEHRIDRTQGSIYVRDYAGTGPAFVHRFEQQLGDLHAVVESLGLDKIVSVGHDSSGPAAVNYAIENPEYVDSICLLNSFYAESPTAKYPELIELFATRSGVRANDVAVVRRTRQKYKTH